MNAREVMATLDSLADSRNVSGMARFGIRPSLALGVAKPALRKLARDIGPDHELAAELWRTGVHEARVLASMIEEPAKVDGRQMDDWAGGFDSWDICDQCCLNLFWRTGDAYGRAEAWARSPHEYVKRAGFVLMACLAIHDKTAGEAAFRHFLGIIKSEAGDDRNMVRKGGSWALRQIGKRSRSLRKSSLELALELQASPSAGARWIGRDAGKELSRLA